MDDEIGRMSSCDPIVTHKVAQCRRKCKQLSNVL